MLKESRLNVRFERGTANALIITRRRRNDAHRRNAFNLSLDPNSFAAATLWSTVGSVG